MLTTPDFIHQHWCVSVDRDTKPSDVLSSRFWKGVAERLSANDTIEIVSEHFDALLRVTVSGDGLVVTRPIYIVEAGAAAERKIEAAGRARTEFVSGKKKWRALSEDGSEISSGHGTQAEPEAALSGAAA
jgi:hypothetical protein